MLKDYYVGLDIGTSSVGWAVTDESYNVLKFNRKKMWGVRLFDEAKTAEKRRTFRGARRRLDRKKERINLLQNFFAEEIAKVDPNFFLRLYNSDLYMEDKDQNLKSKYTLFNDKDFKDKDFHKKYPTIHHLLMDLIEDDSKKDIRLVYLACHYLLKNRGHFIFEGQKFDNNGSINFSINKLLVHLHDYYDIDIEINSEDMKKLITILSDKTLGKNTKKKELKSIIGDTKFLKAISAIMIGSKQNLADLFENPEDFDDSIIDSVEFSKADYDKNYSKFELALGDKIALVNILKEIYDSSILENLLKEADKSKDGNKYISNAFVKKYDKHGADLKEFKRLIRKYNKAAYTDIFRSEKSTENYVAYTKSSISNNKRVKADKFADQETFYNFIEKHLQTLKDNINKAGGNQSDLETVDKMLEDVEFKNFMPKIKSSDNGVIPYQLKLMELNKILENQSNHHEFLNVSDEYGSVCDKIASIMEFRIPYYVGPLNPESKYAWIKKQKDSEIKPWNFKDVVDLDSSREEFIDNLIGRCTYLKDEKVLPKSSLLYNEFMVLNELNNLKLNDLLISEEMKKKIFDQLFKTRKKVTLKAVSNLLKKDFNITGEILLSGTDGDFKQSLNSYIDFKNILGEKIDSDACRAKVEEIIKLIVLYVDDKFYLQKKIKSAYKNDFTDNEIKKMSALNYKDWGRLSEKLLIKVEGADKETGESGSIMHFMREYNHNLMELLSNRFTFTEEIQKLNPIDERKLSYEMVDELYLSPSVKRMLWQSLRIVDEIRNIMGNDPEKIFIEMARGKEEVKVRKESRKDQLSDFYKKGKKDFIAEIGEERYNYLLSEIEREDASKFRWDNLYLYYTQLGRCMYSLEPIDISELSSKNIYDQDHIYPKSKIYDDSIENRVLVKKDLNSKKGNSYPIPDEVLNKNCYAYWKMLYDKGLIGQKKYTRLTRRTGFKDEELVQFIERQIVETRQATKETANLLKNICKDSEIVYSKAENASRFRQEFDIVKCRTVNDLHHMHDAYINIVVGNVYNTKFTKDPMNFDKEKEKVRTYNLENMFKYDVKRGDYTAWIADDEKGTVKNATIKRIRKELEGTNYRFTRMNYIESGALFNATLQRKNKGSRPLKDKGPKSSIEKYGGYTNINKACFAVLDIKSNNKTERKLMPVEREIYTKQKNDKNLSNEIFNKYLKDRFGIEDYRVVYPVVKMRTLLKIDGSYYFITGGSDKTLELRSAIQLILPKKNEWAIKQIDKSSENDYLTIERIQYLTEELVDNTFDIIVNKFKTSVFKKSFLNLFQDDKVENMDSKFKSMDFKEKCKTLLMLVKAIRASGVRQDLKSIDLKSDYGRLSSKTNNIGKYQEFKIINQSITGLFENEVDLLKL